MPPTFGRPKWPRSRKVPYSPVFIDEIKFRVKFWADAVS